ncbi:hypothetical protein ABZ397_03465 [Streptomyces sp. NPDC005876]|uniref:hypothetical protein n=1 Tax=Streptomyces sp. NPDC005876 TaxID=3157076 RepID=UPI00340C89B1
MPLHPGERRACAGRHGAGPAARRLRLFALVGVVTGAVVLPYAVATAGSERVRAGGGPPGRGGQRATGVLESLGSGAGVVEGAGAGVGVVEGARFGVGVVEGAVSGTGAVDGKGPERAGRGAPASTPSPAAPPLGLGPATAVRCGPEPASPEGIEAQTCVLTQGERTWARAYYRNAAGHPLHAVLGLLGPAGRTAQSRCAVGAGDEPGSCDTPRERVRGPAGACTAFAEFEEFADRGGHGPLLLRTGSNSPLPTGS